MKRIKTINSELLLNKQLKNKEFRDEYNKLEREFELAHEILKLRKKANLTQKQLAELAGTSQPAIARLESGNYYNLSLAFINKVAAVLGRVPKIHLIKLNR